MGRCRNATASWSAAVLCRLRKPNQIPAHRKTLPITKSSLRTGIVVAKSTGAGPFGHWGGHAASQGGTGLPHSKTLPRLSQATAADDSECHHSRLPQPGDRRLLAGWLASLSSSCSPPLVLPPLKKPRRRRKGLRICSRADLISRRCFRREDSAEEQSKSSSAGPISQPNYLNRRHPRLPDPPKMEHRLLPNQQPRRPLLQKSPGRILSS